jgi:hypothetical protein
LFLTSANGLLRADATGWIGPDGTKSWQEDGGRKPEEGKFKNRLGEENGPKKTACSNRQDQDISITPLGFLAAKARCHGNCLSTLSSESRDLIIKPDMTQKSFRNLEGRINMC